MKEKRFCSLAFLLLAASLLSCGSDPNTSGGDCSQELVSDYNSMRCYQFGDCGECDDDKQRFLSTSPGVDCQASSGFGLNESTVGITESHVQALGCR